MKQDEIAVTNHHIASRMQMHARTPGNFETAVTGLTLFRRDETYKAENCFFEPTISLVVQGRKQTILGSQQYEYGAGDCIVNGVYMPSVNFPILASAESPFLGVAIEVDRYLVMELSADLPGLPPGEVGAYPNISIAGAGPAMLDAVARLVDLLDKPEQIKVMAPLLMRESHYLMLIGRQGGFLRQVNTIGTRSSQIAVAINWLKENFRQPLQVEKLARSVNMGTSTFHRYFKEITSLSPIQYQKRLRLFEAQRLMLVDNDFASNACLKVGYESPSQFNREYKRLFGAPPNQDIARVKSMMALH